MKTNYLHNENCLDTMARMEDNFIDLTVTSPPYDSLRTYNGYSFDFESISKELYRVTKEGGVVVWVVGDETIKFNESGTSFKQALYFKDIGFNLLDTMIYVKQNSAPSYPKMKRYSNQFEYMFVFSKGKPKTFNPIQIRKTEGTIQRQKNKLNATFRDKEGNLKKKEIKTTSEYKNATNVFTYMTGGRNYSDSKLKKHPAIFPEQLANDHILSWSNKNDVVYDCFAGSGTTAKMSIINKRKWIASEMSSEYCNIIHERLKQFDNDIFLNGND